MAYTVPDSINDFVPLSTLTGALIRDERMEKILAADACAYGARFNHIFTELRDITQEATSECSRPYRDERTPIGSTKKAIMRVASLVFMVPNPLPGSDNLTTSSGSTAIQRGFLEVYSYAKNANVRFELRNISLDGTGGMTVNGSSSSITNDHDISITAYTWIGSELLYPSGTVSGDIVELRILWQADSTFTRGYLAGLLVREPQLFNITPS